MKKYLLTALAIFFATCMEAECNAVRGMTLTGVKNFKTYNTIIGSNVTNKITQGPVVVSTGSTTIKASQGTTITKDFQVDLGAEFAITNE